MRGSRISNTITSSVTLGGGGYASPLVITDTGAILPPDESGAAAVVAQVSGVRLVNHGTIIGGSGSYTTSPVGGDGVYFAAGGSVTNMGSISGGVGAFIDGQTVASVDGGVGIDLAKAGGILNYGTIAGGRNGSDRSASSTYSATGGTGVYFQDGGRLSNHGTIFGGNGSNYGGTAGTGVQAVDARLVNAGLIEGGTVGGGFLTNGGIGVDLQGGSLANAGLIIGGAGSYEGDGYGLAAGVGGTGLEISAGGVATNTGTITGGAGSETFRGQASSGGIGAEVDHGTLINHGLISGGTTPTYAGEYGNGANGAAGVNGGAASIVNTGIILATAGENDGGYRAYYDRSGNGGIGVNLSDISTVTNHGGIYGGDGGAGTYVNQYGLGIYGGTGGDGIDFGAKGALTNSGTISAGGGGETTFQHNPRFALADGGIGVDLQSGGLIVNTGLISAGAGGFGHDVTLGADGGIGVNIALGGTLTSSGSIIGGAGGGSDDEKGGNGGAGVYLNGGTLTSSGTITGGAGGLGATGDGTAGDAVQFGTMAATLVIESGAVFNGQVQADASVKDRLELDGKTPGMLGGLGSAFTDFTTIQENAGAAWTLTGVNTLNAAATLLVDGMLTISGTLTNAGSTTIGANAILAASTSSNVLLAGVDLAGGRLAGSATATFSIGTQTGGMPGGIDIQAGAEIQGYGAIDAGGVITDDGKILAQGGILTIGQPITGGGSLDIGAGATVVTGGAVAVAAVVFASGGSGTFDVDVPSRMSAVVAGFGTNDVIDLRNLAADTLSFMSGTLTLESGGKVVDALLFHGSYTTANFQLTSDDQGGSDVNFVANEDMAPTIRTYLQSGLNNEHYFDGMTDETSRYASWPKQEAFYVLMQTVPTHGH